MRQIRRLHRHHDRGAQPRVARQPFGRDPVVDRLAERGGHIGIEHRLRAVQHIADRVAGAKLIERAALDHCEIAAGLAVGGSPVGPAGQRHVGWIAGEIEAIDRSAHDLLFPVIVQIRQQRGAGSAHRGMDIAVDPRGRHGRSLVAFQYRFCPGYRFWRRDPAARQMCARRPSSARVGYSGLAPTGGPPGRCSSVIEANAPIQEPAAAKAT